MPFSDIASRALEGIKAPFRTARRALGNTVVQPGHLEPHVAQIANLQSSLSSMRDQLTAIHREIEQLKGASRAAFLAASVAADGRHADPLSLGRCHAQVYSQNGEDGIIAEIFRRIDLRDRFFVEIGVGNGRENNSRLLLEQGWHGVWVEADERSAAEAHRLFTEYLAQGALKIVCKPVTAENVDRLLDEASVPPTFDFLSLDIDFNTSHVWRALGRRSRVACIEYNASLPPSLNVEVPYIPTASWSGTNWFGAGLKSLERIAFAKGLHLVGCDLLGINAFFVAADETDGRFRAPFTAENHFEPAKPHFLGHSGHPPPVEARRWISIDP